MTDQTPIGRAARAVLAAASSNTERPAEAIARATYEEIDVDELAEILGRHEYVPAYGGCPCGADFEEEPTLEKEIQAFNSHLALAVKNWLTGKDTQ